MIQPTPRTAAPLLVLALLGSAVLASPSPAVGDEIDQQLEFGVKMARRGLWSEALFRFRQAEKLDGNDPHVLNNLAVAYEANGLFEEALTAYRRALELSPGDRDLKQNYSRFVEFYQSFQAAREEEEREAEAARGAGGEAEEAEEAGEAGEAGEGEAAGDPTVGEETPQGDGGGDAGPDASDDAEGDAGA